jgi:hypothetical protein
MRTYALTATLSAAALIVSLALAAPALARGGDLTGRKAHRSDGPKIEFCDTRSRQTADSGSGLFFDLDHT